MNEAIRVLTLIVARHKQEKRPGLGRCLADHMRWTNAFFADAGLFALHTAWQEARCPR
ncbi:MAG: hypothetical protein WAN43_10185 [Rhodomicrobium sp.]